MRVFLSHSQADKNFAETLRRELAVAGVSFSGVNGAQNTSSLEKAIRSADAFLLLLGPPEQVDEAERRTWMLALQDVWENPQKPWIPILLKDAPLPAFVRTGAAGRDVQAIRIRDPKDPGPALPAVLRSLGLDPPKFPQRLAERSADVFRTALLRDDDVPVPPVKQGSLGIPDEVDEFIDVAVPPRGESSPVDPDPIEVYPAVTDEDRARQREDFEAIRKYAESLKH